MSAAILAAVLGALMVSVNSSGAGEADVNSVLSTIPPMPANGPALCSGRFLTPEQGKAMLQQRLRECPTRQSWEEYGNLVKKCILRGADLSPLPERCPLRPILSNKRRYSDYTVENVAFQAVTGYYATGNLYRPVRSKGAFPVVLMLLGHSPSGRFDASNQIACATLARMGAVVLTVDMFGIGESALQTGPEAHRTPLALTMQTWTNMRALDFLLSLEGADPGRVGVSGASGGGTQSFILTALDNRVAVSVPVVMVSSSMFGGCPCESGKPIHRSKDHFTNNAEIAAMAAPRPMLVISDGKDWTQNVPTIEFPFLQKIYRLYNAESNVENVHLAAEGHDYGPSKRQAMYRFMARHLKLDHSAGITDENGVAIELEAAMRVFTPDSLPQGTCRSTSEIEAALTNAQKK